MKISAARTTEMPGSTKRRKDRKTTNKEITCEELSLSEMTSGIFFGAGEDLGVIKAADMHTYARSHGGEETPSPEVEQTPAAKRDRTELTLSQLQDNIVRMLVDKINERADGIEKKADGLETLIKLNTESINALKESSEFLFKELQDVKADVTTMKTSVTAHKEKLAELEDKVNEAERYQRRWNLRLYALKEQEGENLKQRVMEICRAIVPELGEHLQLHIDITHRIGRRDGARTRPVIIRFSSRSAKELIWKNAKGSEYLASRKLRFGEDLTTKDKETRNRLWPHIEAARKEGKKAFFIGPKALIDGRELKV